MDGNMYHDFDYDFDIHFNKIDDICYLAASGNIDHIGYDGPITVKNINII